MRITAYRFIMAAMAALTALLALAVSCSKETGGAVDPARVKPGMTLFSMTLGSSPA